QRTAPAICPDPAVGVLRRHAAGGGVWRAVRFLLDTAGIGRGMDLRPALHPHRHHPQLWPVHCNPTLADDDNPQMADTFHRARSALWPCLDRASDPPVGL